MPLPATIGVVFIEGFADWEYGLLAASAVEWFGDAIVPLSPNAQPVTSIAGLLVTPVRGIGAEENGDLDAIVVVGSDTWPATNAPDIGALLTAVRKKGGLIGGICGGTLPLAKAGMFAEVRHTSNGRDWITSHLPEYAGLQNYVDVPHAISNGGIVSAPGSAPGTFAAVFLEALHPERKAEIVKMRALFSKEYDLS